MSTLQHTVLQQMILSGRGFNTNYLSQRYFHRNEGSTDYATIPEVTLSGDFVIEFDVLLTRDGDRILGTTTSVVGRFFVRLLEGSNSVLQIGVFGSIAESIETPTGFISQNVLSKISISRTGSSVTIANETNGEVFTDPDFTSTPFVISKAFGHLSNNMQGILANLKIYDNGTLIRDYPINDGRSILANAATALGSEIDGLTYALTTAIGGVASIVLSSLSVIGKTYLVEVSYSGVVGDASVRIGGFSSPSFTGTGSHSFVATAITTVNDILGALTGVTSGSVTVSIKEAVGYGTIINGNADDWGLFDKQANGDWKGNGLSVPPWDSSDQILEVI